MSEIIEGLRSKYADNEYMRERLESYLQSLPTIMQNMEREYSQKCTRNVEISHEKALFTEEFLRDNLYFYIPQTESFVEYNGVNYTIVAEDDITHAILGKINAEKRLVQWKYRLRLNILKRIKENTIWSTIPESATIQTLLSTMLPVVFKRKLLAKYFFTIIGDQMLGKKDTFVYFIDQSYKTLLQDIAFQVYLLTNKSVGDCFKLKYYDHKYDTCRIFNGVCKVDSTMLSFVKANILNIVAVSVHYSTRYGNAEGLLNRANDPGFIQSARYLTNHTPISLVSSFIGDYTIQNDESTFAFKDLYFLWRHYLHKNTLPFVISHNNLKSILTQLNIYDAESDKCLKIASRYPTYWVSFRKFWDTNVICHEDINNSYKIEEIVSLYNDWCTSKSLHIQDSQLLEMFHLEYPHIHIEDSKYIMRINCTIWDKTSTIDAAVAAFNQAGNISANVLNMYRFYCNYVNEHHDGKYIASKVYFEEYVESTL